MKYNIVHLTAMLALHQTEVSAGLGAAVVGECKKGASGSYAAMASSDKVTSASATYNTIALCYKQCQGESASSNFCVAFDYNTTGTVCNTYKTAKTNSDTANTTLSCYDWADACEASSVVSWTKPANATFSGVDFDLTTTASKTLTRMTQITVANDKTACVVTMSLSSSGTANTALGGSIYSLSSTTADNANATTLPTLNVSTSYIKGTTASATFYIVYTDNSRTTTATAYNLQYQTITVTPKGKTKAEITTWVGTKTTCDGTKECKLGKAKKLQCCLAGSVYSSYSTSTDTVAVKVCGDADWATTNSNYNGDGKDLANSTGALSCSADTTSVVTDDAALKKFINKYPCPDSGGACAFAEGTTTLQCCMTGKGTPLGGTENANKTGFCAAKTATTYGDASDTLIGVSGDLSYKKTTCTTPNATKTDIDTSIKAKKCPTTGCAKVGDEVYCCMTADVTPAGATTDAQKLLKQKYCAPKTATAGPPVAGSWKGATVSAKCQAALLTVSAAAALAVASTI